MVGAGILARLTPPLLQGCLKEKTLENLEKYVVKDVSCADPYGPLPTLPLSVNSSVLPPTDLPLTSPVCHCC